MGEELLKLWKQYCNEATSWSFEGFMLWLEQRYWLGQIEPPTKEVKD